MYLEGLSPSLRGGGGGGGGIFSLFSPFGVDSPLLAVISDEVVPPSPCEGPPFALGFDVLHGCYQLHDGAMYLSETLHP